MVGNINKIDGNDVPSPKTFNLYAARPGTLFFMARVSYILRYLYVMIEDMNKKSWLF